VLGERLWLARAKAPVPPRYRVLPNILNAAAAAGGLLLLYGLVRLVPWATLTGLAVTMLAKFWFLDRMVWLAADMADDPRLEGWRRRAG